MKKWISQIPFQLVLPCLVLGAVFTLPHAVTWSKYAWQDTRNGNEKSSPATERTIPKMNRDEQN